MWELKNKGFLSGDKPIILLSEYWQPLVKLVATDDKDAAKFLLTAENAEKAVGLLKGRN